ncbi:nucleotidyltransferase family protein [Mahella sp.]|uniref:nucleotidyltransferase family protein n=1 Tax=Mahella sp. TaxID=2798721 RepID=UPI0025B8FEFC|nr:nucleotidyltransferase family protein [Mahella sp.]MBZ4666417.1 molybdopterin-guanine dinucleotide biosynthesis protein A-like protein [Mahella sp.]
MLNAIILAGDNEDGHSALEGNKALMLIDDKPMIEYIIDALRSTPYVGKIAVVGPAEKLKPVIGDKVDYIIPQGSSMLENASKGIEVFASDEHVLILTSDIPMITPDAVEDFIKRSEAVKADFCYPVVNKEINERQFPGIERTYVKLKDGTFTGGNIIYISPAVFQRCKDFAEKLIEFRKEPIKTARLLGIGLLIKLVLGIGTIQQIEQRFGQILNITAKAIISDYPEIGNDVDKPSDIDIVIKYFSQSKSQPI